MKVKFCPWLVRCLFTAVDEIGWGHCSPSPVQNDNWSATFCHAATLSFAWAKWDTLFWLFCFTVCAMGDWVQSGCTALGQADPAYPGAYFISLSGPTVYAPLLPTAAWWSVRILVLEEQVCQEKRLSAVLSFSSIARTSWTMLLRFQGKEPFFLPR